MSRTDFLRQQMGLGPIWQPRGEWFADHPALHQTQQQFEEQGDVADAPATTPLVATADPKRETAASQPSANLAPPVEAATPAPVPPASELDWEALQQAVAACEKCGLCKTRTQTVFGRGNPKARWLLIGEAPGEHEDRQGQPFVGKAGQLLDNLLAATGLDRDTDVYIANVLKCRPPGNRNPTPDEILACEGYLHQQIAHIQPTLILALGRFAVQTLLQTDRPIGQLRGKLHDYRGTPLIATYHPAYLLRTLPDKAKAWQDMVFAKRQFAAISR